MLVFKYLLLPLYPLIEVKAWILLICCISLLQRGLCLLTLKLNIPVKVVVTCQPSSLHFLL